VNLTSRKILLIGAGDAGSSLAGELLRRYPSGVVAGFLDDDTAKQESEIAGLKVLGATEHVERVCREYAITDVIVAIPSANMDWLNVLVKRILSFNNRINVSIVPVAEKFFDNFPIFPSIREFKYSDLLDRNEFSIDLEKIEGAFAGKRILVTGAGGSIGSEICKQLLKFDIEKIIGLGRGENSIYNLQQSMGRYLLSMPEKQDIVSYTICDIKDRSGLERVIKKYKPHVVVHAAAHKHVPIMESNESEALKNNVLGTLNVLELAAKNNVENFVLISTDKAVRPTSVMGATKRMTELLAGYFSKNKSLNTAIVRFGNVLGSRGSVIPLFHEQIKKGGPVTVTDPEMTRYFMSIEEASLLVINAASLSRGGEIFVLDMGSQYNIKDIACKMIELNGYEPGRDIDIEYIGLRPGEKLYEELFYNMDEMDITENAMIYKLEKDSSQLTDESFQRLVETIQNSADSMESDDIRKFIKEYVPEYVYTQ